jgi:hypothetical protein
MYVNIVLEVEALGVFSLDNNPNAVEGSTLTEGVLIGHLCWVPDEGYTDAYDQWIAAEAAALVLGGKVGLAARNGGLWYVIEATSLSNTVHQVEGR